MNIGWIYRVGICLFVFTLSLISYISKQNELTRLKICIPKIEKELFSLKGEVCQLHYEIDQFESPDRLMDLACHPDYAHLKHPLLKDIETIPKGLTFHVNGSLKDSIQSIKGYPIETR